MSLTLELLQHITKLMDVNNMPKQSAILLSEKAAIELNESTIWEGYSIVYGNGEEANRLLINGYLFTIKIQKATNQITIIKKS